MTQGSVDTNVTDHKFGKLEVFEADALLKRMKSRSPYWLLLATPIWFALLVAVNSFTETLVHPDSLEVLQQDVDVLLRREPITGADTFFPLFRDFSTILIVMLFGPLLTVLHRQWSVMETFLQDLQSFGLVKPVADDPVDRYEKLNGSFKGSGKWVVVVALILAGLVVFAERNSGIAGYLSIALGSGADASDWARSAYQGWWASWDSGPWGFAFYFAAIMFGLYYIVTLNVVGVKFTWYFIQVHSNMEYQALTSNPDGYHGWRPFRRLLQTVFAMILISATALTGLALTIPLREFIWLIPLLMIFLMFNPFYVGTAIALLQREMREFRDTHGKKLYDALEDRETVLGEDDGLHYVDPTRKAILDEMERVQSIPLIPFNLRQLVVWFLIYLVPFLTAVVQFVVAVFAFRAAP